MFEVKLVDFGDLTKEEQENQPNNGCGKECANYIKVTSGDETLWILSDAVEPEDATFGRDFSDVVDVIKDAYAMGLKHGKG